MAVCPCYSFTQESLRYPLTIETLQAEKAGAEGRISQLAADLDNAREEAVRERQAAETARTELAKACLRLEAMQRLENESADLRAKLEKEYQSCVIAEQSAAVLTAQKSDFEHRLAEAKVRGDRADQLATELADMRVNLLTTQASLATAGRQVEEAKHQASAARQEAKVAGELAAELRGKLVPERNI